MQKRVAFTTINPTPIGPSDDHQGPTPATGFTNKNNNTTTNNNNGFNNGSKSVVKPAVKTCRFVLKLDETTDQTFPEFSYMDLMNKRAEEEGKSHKNGHRVVKEGGNSEPSSPDVVLLNDPLGEDSEDEKRMKEMAKRFEEKYGPKRKKKKGAYVSSVEDYIDKGMGYDENDPFIDNEEAYDELIPSTLTTKFGGFYINCGQLDFKPLGEEEDECNDERDNTPAGEGGGGGTEGAPVIPRPLMKKRKSDIDGHGGLKRKRLTARNLQGTLVKRKEKTSADLNNLKSSEVNVAKARKHVIVSDDEDEDAGDAMDAIDGSSRDGPPFAGSIDSVIESVVKGTGLKSTNGTVTTIIGNVSGNSSDGTSGDGCNQVIVPSGQAPKLPESLPEALKDALDKIKELRSCTPEGKQKFFKDSDVNRVLLDIEMKCRELPSMNRNQVYAHLGAVLPCTKETLMKRAKKLRLMNEDRKLLQTIAVLKEEVTKSVHDSQSAIVSGSGERQNGALRPKVSLEENKLEFVCNERTKTLIRQFVEIKRQMSHSQLSDEDALVSFLNTEIKSLLPGGWTVSTKGILEEVQKASSQGAIATSSGGANTVQAVSTGNSLPTSSSSTTSTNLRKLSSSSGLPSTLTFIKKSSQVPSNHTSPLGSPSVMTPALNLTTTSSGVQQMTSPQNRTSLITSVTISNKSEKNKSSSNTPVNLSSKETISDGKVTSQQQHQHHHSQQQHLVSSSNTSKPEGLLCSVDKFLSTAIAGGALNKSSRTGSPPSAGSIHHSAPSANKTSSTGLLSGSASARASPTSLLSKTSPVASSHSHTSQQLQQQHRQQKQSHSQQLKQQQAQQRAATAAYMKDLAAFNVEKIIKAGLANYPNANPSTSNEKQQQQRQSKHAAPPQQQQAHHTSPVQQQPSVNQTAQPKKFPGMDYAFEREIYKSLTDGKATQSHGSKTTQAAKLSQQQQQAPSRSSPLPQYHRSSASVSVKSSSQANTKLTTSESKPMVTITPIPQQQQQKHHTVSAGGRTSSSSGSQQPQVSSNSQAPTFSSTSVTSSNATNPSQLQLNSHLLNAQLLHLAQNYPANYPFLNPQYSQMLLNASQNVPTSNANNRTSAATQQLTNRNAAFNLSMHHHSYAAPPPQSDGRH